MSKTRRALSTAEANTPGSERNSEELPRRASQELYAAVEECLARYWVEQGVPEDRARIAAKKAATQVWPNANKGTWCLSSNY